MKRVLITGGASSIGKAFIKEYYGKYQFFNISRDESYQSKLKEEFPNIVNYTASIEDDCAIYDIFALSKPHIVIHTAAIKHIEIIEKCSRRF